MQPLYEESPEKVAARAQNVTIYRRLTGNHTIPADREYWTLANYQSQNPDSEISQMRRIGLLDKRQFHGVDRDETIVAQNRTWHPEANWYGGEWVNIINSVEFNPAMIYLDTTAFADRRAAVRDVVGTMLLCRNPQTVLFANAMLNDPRSHRKIDPNGLLQLICKGIPPRELRRWNLSVENFDYAMTGKTTMMTYVFHRIS